MTEPMDLDDTAFVEWAANVKPSDTLPQSLQMRGVWQRRHVSDRPWMALRDRLERLGVISIPPTARVTEFPAMVNEPARKWLREHDSELTNQHHDYVNAESVRISLLAALDHWEKSACDCCSPTVLDEGLDKIGYDSALWDRLRRFGIDVAQTAQNVVDHEREELAAEHRANNAQAASDAL